MWESPIICGRAGSLAVDKETDAQDITARMSFIFIQISILTRWVCVTRSGLFLA
jgi:hypothetical protein